MATVQQPRLQIVIACLAVLLVTACTMTPGPNSFTPQEAMSMGQVTPATILEVRAVKIQPNASTGSAGSLAGAVVGGVAGHSVGGGHGQALMTIGGVILGSILGQHAENAASAQDALQVIMQTQDGRTISVVQPMGINLYKGQAVWLTRYQTGNGERYRVEPRSTNATQ